MISISTNCIADGIRESTIYTILKINTRFRKKIVFKANILWLQCLSLVVNEVTMIDLKLLILMDKQLQKVKRLNISSTSIFGGLPLIVLMEDFYQFTLVTRKTLWDNPLKADDIYEI